MSIKLSQELKDGERLKIDVKTEGIASVFEIVHFSGVGCSILFNIPEEDVRHLIKLLEKALVVAERHQASPWFTEEVGEGEKCLQKR